MTVRTETAGGSFDTDTGSDALHSGLFKAQTDEPKLVVLHVVPVEAVMPATVSATDLLPEHSRRELELQQLQAALSARVQRRPTRAVRTPALAYRRTQVLSTPTVTTQSVSGRRARAARARAAAARALAMLLMMMIARRRRHHQQQRAAVPLERCQAVLALRLPILLKRLLGAAALQPRKLPP